MHFTLAVVASALFSVASAAQFNITVGKDNLNTFDPPSIPNVAAGDTLSFRFVSKSHSVTQSTFDKPCTAKAGGVDSGFYPVAAGATTFPEWTIQIQDVSAPLWFFCARAPHCSASGMVFAINPTAERTFDTFKATAMGQAGSNTTTPSPSGSTTTTPSPSPSTAGALSLSAQKTSILLGAGLVAAMML